MKIRVFPITPAKLRTWTAAILFTFFLASTAHAASGLIHKWSGDGNANDSVGIANGSITNLDASTNIDVTFVTGKTNQAFAFDGSGLIDFGTTNVAAFSTWA